MRRRAVMGIAAFVVLASLSNWASAFHHHHGGYYAAYPYCSAYPYCAVGYPACGPSYVGCGGYSCGCSTQCTLPARPGDLLRAMHNHCCAPPRTHSARPCGANRRAPYCYPGCGCISGGCGGYGCGGCGGCTIDGCGCGGCGWDGCASGGCVSGDCGNCGANCGVNGGDSSGTIDLPPGAKVISDKVLGEDQTPTPAEDGRSASTQRSSFQLAGLERREAGGSRDFERGLEAFRSGSMSEALRDFTTAAEAQPTSAIYLYYRALAMFEVAGAQAAEDILASAVEVERREGVENWGQRMERVQGRGRLWIEKARREANLVR
jgi:hypothetical protein